MAKSTITEAEYLQLAGLLILAKQYDQALADIERACAALVGEKADDASSSRPYFGHVSDTVYGSNTLDEMLGKMEVTVVEPAEGGVLQFRRLARAREDV